MELELRTRIAIGMDVCDANGDKIGSIARVHHPAGGEEILEVKTGVFGLGKPLYVPIAQVQDLTEGCVFLSAVKDDVDGMGWHDRPPGLDDAG